jgi:hypothetical protein
MQGSDNSLNRRNCEMSNEHGAPKEESVFSRLMNSRVAQVNRVQDGLIGAVLVFKPHVTEQDAKEMLATLADHLKSVDTHQFNPEFGSPVFFVA